MLRLRAKVLSSPFQGRLGKGSATHSSKHDGDHWRGDAALQRSSDDIVLHPPLLEAIALLSGLFFLLFTFLFLSPCHQVSSH